VSLLFLDFTGSGFSGLVAKLCITLRVPMDYIACQATLSMVFPRQQYWSGSPFPSSRNLPDSGIKPGSLALQAESFLTEPPVKPSQVALVVTNPPANAGDMRAAGSMPGLGKSPGGKHGNPLQDSCLENPMDRGTWWARVHRSAKRVGHD